MRHHSWPCSPLEPRLPSLCSYDDQPHKQPRRRTHRPLKKMQQTRLKTLATTSRCVRVLPCAFGIWLVLMICALSLLLCCLSSFSRLLSPPLPLLSIALCFSLSLDSFSFLSPALFLSLLACFSSSYVHFFLFYLLSRTFYFAVSLNRSLSPESLGVARLVPYSHARSLSSLQILSFPSLASLSHTIRLSSSFFLSLSSSLFYFGPEPQNLLLSMYLGAGSEPRAAQEHGTCCPL